MNPALLILLDAFATMLVAIAFGALAAILAKAPAHHVVARLALWCAALLAAAASVWLAIGAVPAPKAFGIDGISALASVALVTGLVVEELIGRDLRTIAGIGDDAPKS